MPSKRIVILKKTAHEVEGEQSETLQQTVVDERQDLEIQKQQLNFEFLRSEHDELKDKIDRDNNIHKWRKWGLGALFFLIVFWLLVICVFLVASGYNPSGFPKLKLSDQVLMTLIGTTTVNVFMLLNVAARWLYGTPKSDKKQAISN